MAVTIGFLKERRAHETRVAMLAEHLKKLHAPDKSGVAHFRSLVESGAGAGAFEDDERYASVGAEVRSNSGEVVAEADVLVCVNAPDPSALEGLRAGSAIVGMLRPTQNLDLMRWCEQRSISAIAFEALPRITRAQKADALSSMSTVAGYRAVIRAAELSPKMFPMMMTAAGTITPARVLVVGAGVAGLQAIATARRLGAIVEAYDIRPATKEQVLSLGARFVELPLETAGSETAGGYAAQQSEEQQRRQSELLASHVAEADVVITTALAPGRPAPRLISAATIARMRPGAVIVDLAAEAGGNCELTQPDQLVRHDSVRIIGPTNLPAEAPVHASRMFGHNASELLRECVSGGALALDLNNDMIGPACVAHGGVIRDGAVRSALGMAPLQTTESSS